MDGAAASFTNRLIQEKSPYLLQHAHNPVDWYPWGIEAFTVAKEQDKPIFLSIGYSSCHWCHVMERESFNDSEVGKALNEFFVPIKVDREELPQIDALYMEFAQTMIIEASGWPLNVLLTPELKPFFASTYLPKHNSRGLIGIIELAYKIHQMWQGEERIRLITQSDKIVDILRTHSHPKGVELPREELISITADILFKIADPVYGGIRGAPKFPLGYQILFLLHYFLHSQDSRALFLVEKTLEMMHQGGIYDHLGGGFSRYSVDDKWLIPHFEKMLYDNAILAISYLEAWRVTGRTLYQVVCEEILDYLLRKMQSPEGGFYSAEDADSWNAEKVAIEGLFYTWTKQEVLSILGDAEGTLFCEFYNIANANEGMIDGRSQLFMTTSIEEFSEIQGLHAEEVEKILLRSKEKLLQSREKRPRPSQDDQVITSWNGLAIQALGSAGFYLSNKDYFEAAIRAAQFVKDHLWKEGRLLRRYREGETKYAAGLDDYAFLIAGLITLFEGGAGSSWLQFAIDLADVLEKEFKEEGGAFYTTDTHDPHLLFRKCHFSDGAEPSGNALHAENLLRLYEITGKETYLHQAEDILRAVKHYLDSYPLGYCYHLKALQRYYDRKKTTLVLALHGKDHLQEELLESLAHKVLPHHSLILHTTEESMDLLPDLAKLVPLQNQVTLYLCQNGACQAPYIGTEAVLTALNKL